MTTNFAHFVVESDYSLEKIKQKLAETPNIHDIIDHRYYNGYTSLHLASEKGKNELVELLLDNGADINALYRDHEKEHTPLLVACFENHLDTAKLLIDRGAKINGDINDPFDPYNLTIPFVSALANYEQVKFLLGQGANVDGKNGMGVTGLFHACRRGKLSIVELLVSYGANINKQSRNEYLTPLMNSCIHKQTHIVKFLLNQPKLTTLNASTNRNRTALFFATMVNAIDIVKLLLDHGAETNIKTDQNETALMYSKRYDHKEIYELLKRKEPAYLYQLQLFLKLAKLFTNTHDNSLEILSISILFRKLLKPLSSSPLILSPLLLLSFSEQYNLLSYLKTTQNIIAPKPEDLQQFLDTLDN